MKPGGSLISISGPPDAEFAREIRAPWILRQLMRGLSYRIRKEAGRHRVNYSFLFMKADGNQLSEIAQLIDSGTIRPVVDRIFPFESIGEAMAYVQMGRAKGKVVVKMR
jgi:alcohol dehydrogenase